MTITALITGGGPLTELLQRVLAPLPALLAVDCALLLRFDAGADVNRPAAIARRGSAAGAAALPELLVQHPPAGPDFAEFSDLFDRLGFAIIEREAGQRRRSAPLPQPTRLPAEAIALASAGPPDPSLPSARRRLLDGLEAERLLLLPLRHGVAWVGVLVFGVATAGDFSTAQLHAARGVAGLVALALTTGRLREDNARRTRELTALHSAALATTDVLATDSALRSLCDQAARGFDADGAGLFILDEAGTHLCGAHLGGDGRTDRQIAQWRMIRVAVDSPSFLSRLWQNGGGAIIPDLETYQEESAALVRRLGVRAVLVVPLSVEGRRTGLLMVGDRRPGIFTRADLTLAEALAEHVGAALARVHAYEAALTHEEQAHFHATLLASVRDAVVATDTYGRITYWNRGAEDVFGLAHDRQTGRRLTDLVPAREHRGLERLLDRVWRGGEERLEWPVRRPDGQRTWVDIRLSLLRDPRGEPLGFLAVAKDVTERRLAERALRRSARKILAQKTELEGILAHLGDGLLLADTSRRVVLVNPAARTMLGGTNAGDGHGAQESAYWHAITPDGAPVADDDLPLARALAGERGPARDLDVLVGGEPRTISVSAAPLTTPEGRLHGAVAVLRDVTEVRRTQQRVTESERLRSLGEMASGVAHDFNNLLAVILGRCELLLRGGSPETDTHLAIVKRAALDGAEMVKRLQAFSGVTRAVPEEATDLAAIMRDVVEFSRPRWKDAAQQRGITIAVSTEIEPLPPIQAGSSELREVLVNLVFNAVDAMPRGGAIRLSVKRHDHEVWLRVSDSGTGMSEAIRRRVFEPFFTTKGTHGAGLGLSMSYGIIARMGGRIEVESVLNAGTTFTIILPYQPMAIKDTHHDTRTIQPLRILLVDDEPQMLRTSALMLEMDGHRVTSAGSGEDALARLPSGPSGGALDYDVVLTDLGMPGMNGMQFVAAIRGRGLRLPCVLVTGWGMELAPADVLATGAQAVLAKPFSAAQLRSTIAELARMPVTTAA